MGVTDAKIALLPSSAALSREGSVNLANSFRLLSLFNFNTSCWVFESFKRNSDRSSQEFENEPNECKLGLLTDRSSTPSPNEVNDKVFTVADSSLTEIRWILWLNISAQTKFKLLTKVQLAPLPIHGAPIRLSPFTSPVSTLNFLITISTSFWIPMRYRCPLECWKLK